MEYIQGEKFMTLADNKKIFYCHTHDANNFFKNLPTKDKFILITHNGDANVSEGPTDEYNANVQLMPDNLVMWFSQNVNVKNEKIQSLPIGLENTRWFESRGFNNIEYMKKILGTEKKIRNLLYINHNIGTNPKERQEPYDLFCGTNFTTCRYGANGYNMYDYFNDLYNHKFILSPEGHGIDTHRLWESQYLKVIPIEKRNINNQFYTDLPICFVDDWKEISETFLEEEYLRITNKEWNLEKLDFNYWKDKILSYATF